MIQLINRLLVCPLVAVCASNRPDELIIVSKKVFNVRSFHFFLQLVCLYNNFYICLHLFVTFFQNFFALNHFSRSTIPPIDQILLPASLVILQQKNAYCNASSFSLFFSVSHLISLAVFYQKKNFSWYLTMRNVAPKRRLRDPQ